MIEIYSAIMLLLALLATLQFEPKLPERLQALPLLWQVGAVVFAFLLIYSLGLLLFNLVYRRSSSKQVQSEATSFGGTLQPGGKNSLDWPGHLILAVAVILILSALVGKGGSEPFLLALLICCPVFLLCTFTTNQIEARDAPLPASSLKLIAGPGFIDVAWSPPDDPRYAEGMLVRTPATLVPSKPWQGKILCRGMLSSWHDSNTRPGVPYLYTVFTYNGRNKFCSTMGQSCAAFPLADPPTNVTYEAERNAIRLRWKVLDPFNLRVVRIIRHAVGMGAAATEEKVTEIEPCESWRDGGLLSATRYDYSICTIDLDGQASEAALLNAATLAEPLETFEAHVKRNRVTLNWSVPEDAADFQGVVLERVCTRKGHNQTTEEIYRGFDSKHVDEGLDYSTPFVYTIQARYTTPIRSERRTIAVVTEARPAGITNASCKAGSSSVSLHWTLPENEPVRQVRLARMEFGPEDKEIVETTLMTGLATEYTDRQVQPDTFYIYSIYVQSTDGHESDSKTLEVTTAAAPPPPSKVRPNFREPSGPVTLTWNPPGDKAVAGTYIVRKQDQRPEDPYDGKTVFDGAATEVVDESTQVGTVYYYALYSYDADRTFSLPTYIRVTACAKVGLTINYSDIGKRRRARLSTCLKMSQLVPALLKQQGLDAGTLPDWTITVEETGRVIGKNEALRDCSVEEGQTLRLSFVRPPAPSKEDEAAVSPSEPTSPPRRVEKEKLNLQVFLSDVDRPVHLRIPATFTMSQLAGKVFKKHGVDVSTLSEWAGMIEESGQHVQPEERLLDAGVQDGQTIWLIYEAKEHPLTEPGVQGKAPEDEEQS